jgi:alpha-L-fucosidase
MMKNSKMDQIVEMASKVVPSERQLKWQELEFYAFIHFGVNTFTNSEWGSGYESPEVFEPTKLDARQWVACIKSAGMRGLIITAKHHDGFCLWPSAYTDHSVKFSPWKGGKGDVVKEVADACREYGIKFGVYLSPWDKHDPRYGEGEAYNKFFKNQLTELLTHYGDVFCVWFDGACGEGKKGKKQEYDWEGYYEIIRELQPDAVISICGPDVRWCGNEAGVTRKSEWSVVPYYYNSSELTAANSQKEDGKVPKKVSATELDIGSRKAIKNAGRLIWYPAEVDVSIRKGWFYHASDDIGVKPLSKLLEIYYNSVGANAAFLLNIPPTKEGLIHERDADMLAAMGAQLSIDFNENLAEDSVMTATCCLDEAHNAQMALSDDPDEYWHSGMNPVDPSLTIDLGDDYDINKVVLGEHIRTGQQIESFKLYGEVEGKWKLLSEGTVIGHKRICRFNELRVQYIKLVIESTRCFATISKFEAY